MRLSSDPRFPGYRPSAAAYVFLNGELLGDCVHADEEAGVVTVYERDRFGNILLDGDFVAVKELRGQVRIHVGDWSYVKSMGFDRWLRNRRALAHHEFMVRIARLPRCTSEAKAGAAA